MGNTYSRLYTHLVFGTKRRDPHLDRAVRPRLWEYMHAVVESAGCELVIAGGWIDHAHLLVQRKPRVCESDLTREVKANSSRWIRETWPALGFGWQDGYAAFSVSFSRVNDVRRYIENQENHHGGMSFEKEYFELLERHGIAYDRRYVWDEEVAG